MFKVLCEDIDIDTIGDMVSLLLKTSGDCPKCNNSAYCAG